MYKRMSLVGVALSALLVLGLARFETASASQFPSFPACHDDSTMVKPLGKRDSGPMHLIGDSKGNNGYYYLTITAGCPGDAPGSTVSLTVHVHLIGVLSGKIDPDGMCWSIHVDLGYNHNPLDAAVVMANDVTVVYNQAVAGKLYRIRIANLEDNVIVQEHSSVDG